MKHQSPPRDIESLNELIVNVDLDELEAEALDERIELTVAALFGDPVGDPAACGQFSCTGYWPSR